MMYQCSWCNSKKNNMEQNNWQGGRLLLAYVLAPDLEAGKGAAAAFCGR